MVFEVTLGGQGFDLVIRTLSSLQSLIKKIVDMEWKRLAIIRPGESDDDSLPTVGLTNQAGHYFAIVADRGLIRAAPGAAWRAEGTWMLKKPEIVDKQDDGKCFSDQLRGGAGSGDEHEEDEILSMIGSIKKQKERPITGDARPCDGEEFCVRLAPPRRGSALRLRNLCQSQSTRLRSLVMSGSRALTTTSRRPSSFIGSARCATSKSRLRAIFPQ